MLNPYSPFAMLENIQVSATSAKTKFLRLGETLRWFYVKRVLYCIPPPKAMSQSYKLCFYNGQMTKHSVLLHTTKVEVFDPEISLIHKLENTRTLIKSQFLRPVWAGMRSIISTRRLKGNRGFHCGKREPWVQILDLFRTPADRMEPTKECT